MTASIHSLPEELLIAVFMSTFDNEDNNIPHIRTTMALTSKYWHRIIYYTSSFWTKIHKNHTNSQIAFALIQSRNAPLDVYLDLCRFNVVPGDDPTVKRCFVEVCRHLPRWRVARLHTPARTPWDSLQAPAPLLESVSITGPGEWLQRTRLDLFRGQAPRITSLHLKDLSISWSTGMFSSLISLRLEGLHAFGPTVQQITTILRSSPQITVLCLCLIQFHSIPPPPSPLVHLPDLQTLEFIIIKPAVIGHFLNIIRSPPCRRLRVECRFDHENPDRQDDLLHLERLPYFLPLKSQYKGPATLRIAAGSVFYAFRADYPNTCEILLEGLPADATLRYLASLLPPEYLAMNTEVELRNIGSSEMRTILDPVDVLHVTRLDASNISLGTEGYKELLQQLGSMRRGRWMLPALRELTFDLQDSPPGFLAMMVKARYGVNPNNVEAAILPAPFTRLAIVYPGADHEADREVVQRIVGDECLFWGASWK